MTQMNANDGDILFNEESFAIVGACFEVHNEKSIRDHSRHSRAHSSL
jgi:hypothetical protein